MECIPEIDLTTAQKYEKILINQYVCIKSIMLLTEDFYKIFISLIAESLEKEGLIEKHFNLIVSNFKSN